MTPVFYGQVKDGKLSLDKRDGFQQYLHTLNGKRIELTVEKLKHKRSLPQNAFFHGVTCKLISDSTGTDLEVVKNFLKEQFGAKVFFMNKWVPKPTHLMDTIEMGELLEKSRIWASEYLNVIIPLPGEVTE